MNQAWWIQKCRENRECSKSIVIFISEGQSQKFNLSGGTGKDQANSVS